MFAWDKKKTFLFLLIALSGFFLRLNSLGSRSLWTDEFFTLFQASGHGADIERLLAVYSRGAPSLVKAGDLKFLLHNDPGRGFQDVGRGLLETDTHPPLYFWIMHFWMRVFSDTAFAVRLFSLIMGLAAISAAYYLGRFLFDDRAAVFCALFLAISCFAVRYSQEARAYSLILTIGLLSWIFILRFAAGSRLSDALGFSIINSLGIYTHYFYLFISLAQFVYFTLSYRRDRRRVDIFYLAFILSLLLFLPWFKPVLLKGYNFKNAEWVFGYPGNLDKVSYLAKGLLDYYLVAFGQGMGLRFLARIANLAFLIYMLWLLVLALRKRIYRRQIFSCLAIFLLPLSGMFIIDLIQHGALLRQERFWMFSFVGFIPLAGYSLSRLFLKSRVIGLVFISLLLYSSLKAPLLEFGPAPRYASEWINQQAGEPGKSAVMVYNIRSVLVPQAYYLSAGITLIPVTGASQVEDGLRVLATKAEKVFVVRHYHPTDPALMDQGFMDIGEARAGFRFKDSVYRDGLRVSEYIKIK